MLIANWWQPKCVGLLLGQNVSVFCKLATAKVCGLLVKGDFGLKIVFPDPDLCQNHGTGYSRLRVSAQIGVREGA